jgi:GT2 family glycosyltransferase
MLGHANRQRIAKNQERCTMAFSLSGLRPLAACTIISRNYLSHARVLAESFFRHEPGGRFYLLVVDKLPGDARFDSQIRLIEPEALALPYLEELTFAYDVIELCTAVKPTLLTLLLNQCHENPIVYFDPDILITGPLNALRKSLDAADIVLTPHLLEPIPPDGRLPSESDILVAGAYNLGFLALRKSSHTARFLGWWQDRLRDGCVVDLNRGLMTDQKWVDLVPGFFPGTTYLRDATYNVAYWNIHSRILEERGGQFLVNGEPLTFFHFSGFDPGRPQEFSKHQTRTPVIPGTALAKLLGRYVECHLANGFLTSSRWSYGYGRFDNGFVISQPLRQAYRELNESARAQFGNPFHVGETGTFLDWATHPEVTEHRLSPFLRALRQVRTDVAQAWPDVNRKDREAFLSWVLESGPREMGYDPEEMRVREVLNASANSVNHSVTMASQTEGARHRDPFIAGPRCSVIIPARNPCARLHRCLETLLAHPPMETDWEIIVVDQGLADSTRERFAQYGGRIRVVRNSDDSSTAAAWNLGVEAAAGEYLIYLSPDILPEPGWLDALVIYADQHPAAAAVGSKLLFPNGTIKYAGIVIGQDRLPRALYGGFPADHSAVNQSRRLQAISGRCMLLRRLAFQEIGCLDPDFPDGYAEVDLCLRLADGGYEVHYCHASVLTCLEAGSLATPGANEKYGEEVFLSRWAERVVPDDVQVFLADGLLTVEYEGAYPLRFSLSPLLGVVPGEDEQVQAHRLLAARSRQVYELLRQASRLELGGHEVAKDLATCAAPANGQHHAKPRRRRGSEAQLLFRGEVRWLSQESTSCLISVLLPVKNGAAKLRELLPRIADQRCRHPVEIVAVDSGSTDDTIEVLRHFRTTAVAIHPSSFNHGLTRNLAAEYARGDFLVFVNQGTLPADEHWLANLVAPFESDPTLAGVCGRILPRPEADLLTAKDIRQNINASIDRYARAITDREEYEKLEPHERRLFVNFHTLSAAIRSEVFRRLPFREADFAEDLIWGKDALEHGFRIQYEPSAVAFHSHNYSLLEVFRRLFDDGLACRAIVGKQLTESDVLPKIVQEFRDDWRYLEDECRLHADELERWQLISLIRRTAQVLGLWIGMDWEPDQRDLLSQLSLTERIKAGLPTEADGGWRI